MAPVRDTVDKLLLIDAERLSARPENETREARGLVGVCGTEEIGAEAAVVVGAAVRLARLGVEGTAAGVLVLLTLVASVDTRAAGDARGELGSGALLLCRGDEICAEELL